MSESLSQGPTEDPPKPDQPPIHTFMGQLNAVVGDAQGQLSRYLSEDAEPLAMSEPVARGKIVLPDPPQIDHALTAEMVLFAMQLSEIGSDHIARILEVREEIPLSGGVINVRFRTLEEWTALGFPEVGEMVKDAFMAASAHVSAVVLFMVTIASSPVLLPLDSIIDSPERRKIMELMKDPDTYRTMGIVMIIPFQMLLISVLLTVLYEIEPIVEYFLSKDDQEDGEQSS